MKTLAVYEALIWAQVNELTTRAETQRIKTGLKEGDRRAKAKRRAIEKEWKQHNSYTEAVRTQE